MIGCAVCAANTHVVRDDEVVLDVVHLRGVGGSAVLDIRQVRSAIPAAARGTHRMHAMITCAEHETRNVAAKQTHTHTHTRSHTHTHEFMAPWSPDSRHWLKIRLEVTFVTPPKPSLEGDRES